MSLKDKINKVKTKIDVIKKDLESDQFGYQFNKDTSDAIIKDAKEAQKYLGDKLEKFKADLKNRKLKKKNKKNIFEELVDTVSRFLEAGRKVNETDRYASIERLKFHAYSAAEDTMKSSRKIILECAQKVLFAGDGICGGNRTFDSSHDSLELSPKEFDFFDMFRVSPKSDYGKLMYEPEAITNNKEKLNRELYSGFTSLIDYQFDTLSNKTLFTAHWNANTQKYEITNLSQSGSTSQNPQIGEFFNEYYSNIEMPDLVHIVKQAMFLTTKSVKANVDSTGLNIGGAPTGMEDNLSFSPELDEAINNFERMINKIFSFCNTGGVGLGKQTAFRIFDDSDEDSNFYFDFDDVEGIDLEDEDARRRKVLIFKDCNNFEIPYNANHFEDFIYLEGKKPVREWVSLTLDKVALDAYELSFGGIRLPDFQISLNLGFLLNIPKAIIASLISPKMILPIAIVYKLFVGVATDVKDLLKKMKEWFLCIINNLFWNFIRFFWKKIKADLKNFLSRMVRKILRDKLKRYYLVINTLIALLKKIIEDGIETCEDLFDVIGKTIDLTLDLAGAKNFKIPLPLLYIADQLPGFSATRTAMDAQEKMSAMGIPTGPVNGEPNDYIASFAAYTQAIADNIAKTPFISTNKEMKLITPLGPGIVLPMQGQSGALMKI